MAEHLDEILIDDDDLNEVLKEIERSFGVSLPNDLRHIRTAGDLFVEIRKIREPDGAGDRCDTAMVFFILRRTLRELGLPNNATPRTALIGRGMSSPRRVKLFLKESADLETPPLVLDGASCAAMLLVVLGGIGLMVAGWSWGWLAWALVVPIARFSPGIWQGEWETLGSLARAVSIRNVAHLAGKGARNRESDWWRSFSRLLAGSAIPESKGRQIRSEQITPDTRFKFN